jgi:methylmalonyl-CoA epimerase
MPPYPLDHVAIATPSIKEAASMYELLTGDTCSPVEEIPSQGVRVAFVGKVELLEPLGAESGVGRFLQRRGSGLHHIAFQVPDLPAALQEFASQGFRLIDEKPRTGAGGHQVAFIHPASAGGVLWELVQH